MLTLNNALKTIKELRASNSAHLEHGIMGMNETLNRLWIVTNKKDREGVSKRLANLLISTLVHADKAEIEDIETHFHARIKEIREAS